MLNVKRGWCVIGRRPARGVHKPQRWVPLRDGADYLIWSGDVRWTLRWVPRRGFLIVGWYRRGEYQQHSYPHPRTKGVRMKRRHVVGANGAPRPALSGACKELDAYPMLREFLSATAYEDGTARTPGYLWLSNRGAAYELILFDPDTGARAPFMCLTISDCFLAAELHLMSEEGAWQPDRYLQEQLAKKKPRKGS